MFAGQGWFLLILVRWRPAAAAMAYPARGPVDRPFALLRFLRDQGGI